MKSIFSKYIIITLSLFSVTSCSLYQKKSLYSFAKEGEVELISTDGKRSLFWTDADTGLSIAFPLREYKNVQYQGSMQNSSIKWVYRLISSYKLNPEKILFCVPDTLFAFIQSGKLDSDYHYKPNCVVKRGHYSNYSDAVSFYAPEVYPIEKDDILRLIDLDKQNDRLVIIDRFSVDKDKLLVIVYVLTDSNLEVSFPITIQNAIDYFTPFTLNIASYTPRGLP